MDDRNAEGELSSLDSQLNHKKAVWKHEFERHQSHVEKLEEKLMELKVTMKCTEGDSLELKLLRHRVKTTAALLAYLKSKARIMASPNLANAMESLVMRAIKAESEAANERVKVKLGLEENERKTLQVLSMTVRVEEMEKFALSTNALLNEMRQKVEDMVEESSRQRQRATENEQELCRVKQDFDSLRSFVGNIISISESLLSSESQFQTIQKLLDRLVTETAHLEDEKAQKEAEVQKLMEENVRLRALLDNKESQLLAMNEQYKWMLLNNPGI
ncbi:golgin subfamily A member 5-like isoform X2 [Zingiber officinale]|uniref:golgin subfamily A member 5-like isoform X2 n=1 Tax=Zingiber officinale TaxID=94328 RepID=UPI001C4C6DFB|nr:golgin subfamily A member 5-like isoform X2 [Zingiber officinale]